MKVFGIIPARSGSKGVPNKNFREVADTPLIDYTLRTIEDTNLDRCFVTTDDDSIIAYTKENYPNVEVPFKRPSFLATDASEAVDVALNIIDHFESIEDVPDYVCWLQPTSPLRTAQFINYCLSLLSESVDSVTSVRSAGSAHPYKAKGLNAKGFMEPFVKDVTQKTNRQSMPVCYMPDGCVFIANIKVLIEMRSFFGKTNVPAITPDDQSHDIDTLYDLHVSELLLKHQSDQV